MRSHGQPPAVYAVPLDDIAMRDLHSDMGLYLALERRLCFECERCAGCISEDEWCSHVPCKCELRRDE